MNSQAFQLSNEHRQPKFNRSRQEGVTLLEVLVAMIIFLLVTGTIWGLLEVGRVDRNRSSVRSDVLKNIRMSVNLIGRDALNAGLGYSKTGGLVPDNFLPKLFGKNDAGALLMTPDTNPDRDLLSGIIVGNNVIPNDLAGAGVLTDTIAFAFNDPTFNPQPPAANANPPGSPANPGGALSLSKYVNTGPEAVQIAGSNRNGSNNSVCTVNSIYLIGTSTTTVAVMSTGLVGSDAVAFNAGDPLGINLTSGGSGNSASLLPTLVYPASMQRVYLVSYRVTQKGTLIRTTFGNYGVNPGSNPGGQPQEQELAYNVENMQIQYLLNDGTVTDDPSNNGSDYTKANNIRQVTITLTAQGSELDTKTGKPIKITLSSTFSTRNMNYNSIKTF